MANKSISMIKVRRIIQLLAEGKSKLKISESLHIHRATLEKYLFKLRSTGKSFSALLKYDDNQLSTLVFIELSVPKAGKKQKGIA